MVVYVGELVRLPDVTARPNEGIQEVSHRRLRCAGPSPAYLRSSTVQFFPLIVITQSIVTSAWAIYGMASIIVRHADAEPQAA